MFRMKKKVRAAAENISRMTHRLYGADSDDINREREEDETQRPLTIIRRQMTRNEPPRKKFGRECMKTTKPADSVMMFVFVFLTKTTPKRVPAMYYEGGSSYYGDPINFEPYSHTAPSLQGSFAFTMEPPPAITLGACQCQRVWRYHGTREVRRLIFGGVNITQ